MTLIERLPSAPVLPAPVLATARLRLRALQREDASTIATLANERRIAENTARIPHPYTLADAKAFSAAANRSDREIAFLITLADGTPIGACGLELRDGHAAPAAAGGAAPELGYWPGPPHWG